MRIESELSKGSEGEETREEFTMRDIGVTLPERMRDRISSRKRIQTVATRIEIIEKQSRSNCQTLPCAIAKDNSEAILRERGRGRYTRWHTARTAAGKQTWGTAWNTRWHTARTAAGNHTWGTAWITRWHTARTAAGQHTWGTAWNTRWHTARTAAGKHTWGTAWNTRWHTAWTGTWTSAGDMAYRWRYGGKRSGHNRWTASWDQAFVLRRLCEVEACQGTHLTEAIREGRRQTCRIQRQSPQWEQQKKGRDRAG
jgi:hypothetical protein